MLPHVGIVLGNLPLILLLLALRSDLAAIVAAVVIVACQLVDSYVVRRRISLYSVHVGLLVPWVVVLVGYAVYGVGGAAFGLAFAVFGLAILDELGARRRAAEAESESATEAERGVEAPTDDVPAAELAEGPAPPPTPSPTPTPTPTLTQSQSPAPTPTPSPTPTPARAPGHGPEAMGSASERSRS
jgi:hypothetical protein